MSPSALAFKASDFSFAIASSLPVDVVTGIDAK